jgi:hypothetical protein
MSTLLVEMNFAKDLCYLMVLGAISSIGGCTQSLYLLVGKFSRMVCLIGFSWGHQKFYLMNL